jgi:hypothetical protein
MSTKILESPPKVRLSKDAAETTQGRYGSRDAPKWAPVVGSAVTGAVGRQAYGQTGCQLLTVRDDKATGDVVLTSVNRSHPLLRGHTKWTLDDSAGVPPAPPSAPGSNGGRGSQGAPTDPRHPLCMTGTVCRIA